MVSMLLKFINNLMIISSYIMDVTCNFVIVEGTVIFLFYRDFIA